MIKNVLKNIRPQKIELGYNPNINVEMIQEILRDSRKRLPMLEAMTKEERIEYFRKGLFPRKLDFDLDFGSTVIHVNTRFAENSKENVIDRVRRVSDKIN